MSLIRKLRQLSANEWLLLVQAQALLPLTLVGVRIFGVSRWQSVLAKTFANLNPYNPATARNIRIATVTRMVGIASHYGILVGNCLERSMVLWCLLANSGIESEIRFGARKQNENLQAHAWVELNGVPLNDQTHTEFLPLPAR
jgi:hypothetical protein